jgi:hypothetical protein
MYTKGEGFRGTNSGGEPYKQILAAALYSLDAATDDTFTEHFGRLATQDFGIGDDNLGDTPTGYCSRQTTPHGFDFR